MLPDLFSRLLDRALLTVLGIVPPRAMRRILQPILRNPKLSDRWGVFIRQRHFYDPLPDFPTLDPQRLERRRESPGIDWGLSRQLETVGALSQWAPELKDAAVEYDFSNDLFTALDSAVYYTVLRWKKPKRVIEIGGGYSTQIAALALKRNAQEEAPADHLCIEPYPGPQLEGLPIRLQSERIEHVPLDLFRELGAGDVLFIDSTHTVKFDSDVCREVLDILPVLAPGVWIHFHDIFFPYDYPARWILEERRAWNEQYLVEALLQGSKTFGVRIANNWLATDYPEKFSALWPPSAPGSVSTTRGGSLWIERLT